jgi:redox-sensitive bicupin YhaK (pirin superfamily)
MEIQTMMTLRDAGDRGHVQLGWLDSHHSFSFGDYYDPQHMGISNLRVINDDIIAPGGGFPTHGHSDMEIVTYVLDGALQHKDSMGNGSVIRAGDVQRMSAGKGVRHSEYNASRTEPVRLLQIWLLPNRMGVEPGYDQRHFSREERRGRLALLVSPDGRDGSIAAHQDALLYGALLGPGESVEHRVPDGRQTYVHVARGRALVSGERLADGDAVRIRDEPAIRIEGSEATELLVFDLP